MATRVLRYRALLLSASAARRNISGALNAISGVESSRIDNSAICSVLSRSFSSACGPIEAVELPGSHVLSPVPTVLSARGEETNINAAAARSIKDKGFVFLTDMFVNDEFDMFAKDLVSHVDDILDVVAHVEERLEIGSAKGYHEVCLRSSNRFDVPTYISGRENTNSWAEDRAFPQTLLGEIEAIASDVLEEERADKAFAGCVHATPPCPHQYWHADSLHLSNSHTSANLVNVLVALHDTSVDMGPTEFIPGSHEHTNHMRGASPDIVYQDESNTPESIGLRSSSAFTMALPKGSAIMFDDRVLHRGLGNTTKGSARSVAYFSYKKRAFEPSTHFEATRSIFDAKRRN